MTKVSSLQLPIFWLQGISVIFQFQLEPTAARPVILAASDPQTVFATLPTRLQLSMLGGSTEVVAALGPGEAQTWSIFLAAFYADNLESFVSRPPPFVLRDFFWRVDVPGRLSRRLPFADWLPLDQV